MRRIRDDDSAGLDWRMLRALAFLVVFACSPRAMAWGELGHRLVGALAEQELTPAARREVQVLLAGEPDPTLPGVSAWADRLRSVDPGLGRRSAPWHYVNLGEDACVYEASRDCRRGDCILGALKAQLALLGDRGRTVEERRRALKFVVHLVGDVHQPLHAAYARDKGGNTVQLRVPSDSGERGSNLHAWWDSGLVARTGLDEAGLLARLRSMPVAFARDGGASPDIPAWAEASCRIAVSPGFYPARRRLGPGYEARWLPVALDQLRRGGTRLAGVLNAALGP